MEETERSAGDRRIKESARQIERQVPPAKLCRRVADRRHGLPFSNGIGDWSRRSSTAPNSAARPGDRAPVQRSRIWWFASLARTPGGITIGLWERWPTWGTRCPTRPWATSCAGTASSQRRRGAKRLLGRSSFAGIWMFSLARTSSAQRLLQRQRVVEQFQRTAYRAPALERIRRHHRRADPQEQAVLLRGLSRLALRSAIELTPKTGTNSISCVTI
jgi:hypothetical protein